jgi:crotonobetainyl-CoA:carnitine CoA-transferase CaiB-like acyl-CoA transferase
VTDLSSTFMGPYATCLMAQMGARVVKVEPPGGDVARFIGDTTGEGLGPIFLNANRGKESVVLDLKDPIGREAVLRLADRSDVFVHNLRPASRDRLGLSYPTLSGRNPSLVYCGLVGFGSGGPYADRAAYDDVVQAASGLAAVQGGGGPPAYVRSAVADKTVGVMALAAVLAALVMRDRTGRGQEVEVPMFESMTSFLLLEQQGAWVHAARPGQPGYARMASDLRRPYRTADGYIGVLVYTDAQWREFFALIGRPELASEERYSGIGARTEHTDELYALVEAALTTRTTTEWLTILDERGIPAMRVNGLEDLFDDPHLGAVGFFERVRHPVAGELVHTRLPWRFSAAAVPSDLAAPSLGAHTAAVLEELGFGPEDVARLGVR